jgi:geranylgeranyl diphosphate synthase type I
MVRTTPAAPIATSVTNELLEFLDAERSELEAEAGPLIDELETIVRAGGKRVRPRFCYWGHIAAGGETSAEIFRVGAALELLHTFAVIHDDVMDQAPLRRRRLSTFRALAELAAALPHRGDPARFGTSAALLTGLLGFVLADRLFLTSGFPSDVMARAANRYDRMRTRTIAGQYLDLLAAHRGDADVDVTLRIAELKSAGYTVTDPLVMGALCASGDAEVVAILEAYGTPLGQAFQLRDDVLGLFGDPAETGKDRDGDVREGKQTFLVAKARELATAEERAFLDGAMGDRDLSPADADRVRDVVASCGALDATERLIDELSARARSAVESDVVGAEATEALLGLVDEVATRTR